MNKRELNKKKWITILFTLLLLNLWWYAYTLSTTGVHRFDNLFAAVCLWMGMVMVMRVK